MQTVQDPIYFWGFYKDMHISGKPVFLTPVEEESVESVSFAKVTS